MQVAVEKLPQSQVKLRIELSPDEVKPFLERAARDLSKEHTPKGFRPGSAPLDVMRSAVGDQKIIERAAKELVPRTYVDSLLDREDVEAIGQPDVMVETAGMDGAWVYVATVSVLPTVTLGAYRAIRGTRRTVTVEPAEIDRELEHLRKLRATYLSVPRPAQTGDRVDVHVTATAGQGTLEGGEGEQQSIILGEGNLLPGFEEQLLGVRADTEKTFPVTVPENHHRADLRGQVVQFRVRVGAVQQRALPELTDHFAQGLGQFASLKDLKDKLTAHLREEKEHHERERFHQELLAQVITQASFGDFATPLVERELDTMLGELQDSVTAMGLRFDDYLAQVKKTKHESREGLRPQALARIRAGLTLRAIAKAEDIRTTDAEIAAELQETLKDLPNPKDAKRRFEREALRDMAAGTIRNRKVFTLLEDLAARNGT